MSKKKKLNDLFIEDLGRAVGGKKPGKPKPTTLALGEEGPIATTLAIGEEDATTLAIGEEGATTLALGEEYPDI